MTNKELFEALRMFEKEKDIPMDYMLMQIEKAITIACKNYFDGNVTMVDGLPQTTAADPTGHGLGSRSMRDVAEKYGGSVTFSSDGDVFHVNVLVPIPEG